MKCPLGCHKSDPVLIATKIREGEGRIVQCPECRLVMQDLDWDEKKIADYYNEEYLRTNSLVANQELSAKQHFHDRSQTIMPIFNHLKPLLKKKMNVLEVGCGAGELLALIKPKVRSCVGVEMTRSYTDFIQSTLGIEARPGDVTQMDWKGRKFDLIICIDSLDHMRKPLEVLGVLRGLLSDKGSLWLTVPNLHEALNQFLPEPNRSQYRQFFWHRAHFFYFDTQTLPLMLTKAGFKVAGITYYHQYTFKNFLNWYFTGKPQQRYLDAGTGVDLFSGADPFETRMNQLMRKMEPHFHKILQTTGRGDTLWCHARLSK